MPVRWTPENDQILLLKIIETHELAVDTKRVSEAWPGNDPDSAPTPRAISERLHKIRNTAKQNGGSSAAGPKSPATRKRGPKGGSTPGSKRARKTSGVKADPDSSPSNGHVKQEVKELVNDGASIFNGNGQVKGLFSESVLAKRVRTTPSIPFGMVRYVNDDTDEEAKYDTGSEFNPDGEAYDDEEIKSDDCA